MSAPSNVSVIVPSFNQARFLPEALDSILSQNYPELEVIVIDGASTDGSLEILKSYGDRIQFVSESDHGQSHAINKGFSRARGEILCWLNSDDRQVPGAMTSAVAALGRHPEAAMVYGDGELIDENGIVMTRFPATQPFDLWYLIHVWDYIMQPTVFMRAQRLREIGGLDESLEYGMDWDLWIRLACRWPVVYLPEVLAQTREYTQTKTATGGWKRLRELRTIMARHGAPGWSPGMIIYAIDTLRRSYPALFGPSTLPEARLQQGHRFPRLMRPVHRLVETLVDHQVVMAQGTWRDGWMGARAFRSFAWNGDSVLIRAKAEVPPYRKLLPFSFEVTAAGQRTCVVRHEPGPFEVTLAIPPVPAPARAIEVVLRGSPSWRPPGDRRRLSCRLHDVQLESTAALEGRLDSIGWGM